MILLKSIPLSLGVLWRFFIVMAVFFPIAFVVTAVFSLIPIIGSVVSTVVSAFATLVGFRIAFQAAGAYSAPVFRRLLVGAIKWGMLETLIYGIVFVVILLLFAGAAQLLEDQYAALGEDPRFGDLLDIIISSPLMLSVGAFSLGLFYLVSTLLAVPKAATAYSAGNKSQQLPLFWGTGYAFLTMLIISVAGTMIMYWSGGFAQLFALLLHALDLVGALIKKSSLPWLSNEEYLWMGGAVVLNIWTYCWWYAAGGLAVIVRLEEIEAARVAARPTEVTHSVDLTELRKSRMQKDLGNDAAADGPDWKI